RGLADRSHGAAPRHLRLGIDLSGRAGRALLHRSARALVGGVASGPYRHTTAALCQPALKIECRQPAKPDSKSILPVVNDRREPRRFPAAKISMQIASHWQAFARYLGAGRAIKRWQCVVFGANTNRRGNEPDA